MELSSWVYNFKIYLFILVIFSLFSEYVLKLITIELEL